MYHYTGDYISLHLWKTNARHRPQWPSDTLQAVPETGSPPKMNEKREIPPSDQDCNTRMTVSLCGNYYTDGIKIGPVFQEGAHSFSTGNSLVMGSFFL